MARRLPGTRAKAAASGSGAGRARTRRAGAGNRPTKRSKRSKPAHGGDDAPPGRPPVDPVVNRAARLKGIHRRMMLVGLVLFVAMGAAAGRVVVLQLVDGDRLQLEAARNYVRTLSLDERRGDIVDRRGHLMAVTVHRWAVTADPQQVADPEATAQLLAPIIGMAEARLARRLGGEVGKPDELEELQAGTDVLWRTARDSVQPAADLVAELFDFPAKRFERPFALLDYFHRMEEARIPGLAEIVRTLSRAADAASRALSRDQHALRFFPKRGRRFAYLGRDLDDETANTVEREKARYSEICRRARAEGQRCINPLRGVRVRPEPRRYYPKRELGTQVVGLVGSDSKALGGIERAMEGVLGGGHHRTRVVRDRRGREMHLEGVPEDAPLEAHTVELTLDDKIQAKAEEVLGQACQVTGARAGYAIVQHVSTGEILAAASYPGFNPNTFRAFYRDRQPLADEREALHQARRDLTWAAEWELNKRAFPGRSSEVHQETSTSLRERYDDFVEYEHTRPSASRHTAFQDVYEPGSIMKVFTIAGWLEAGVKPLDHVYDLEGGHWELEDADDNVIHDDKGFDHGDPLLILKKSSNIGTAKMAFDLGARGLEDTLRAFGFGSLSGSGYPGEARGILRPSSEWKKVEFANISFGQGTAATGVQLVTALSALANDGALMRPLLVRRVLDSHGREVTRWEPTVVRQVVSPDTARTVLDLMHSVVLPGGTGTKAHIPEYPVAGKTGTGQKPHLRKRGYAENMWVGTFFGVAPIDDPELAVLVLIDEPKGKRYGGVVAAPAFRKIMRWSLKYLGVPSPYDQGRQVAWLDPETLTERRAAPPVEDSDLVRPDLRPPVAEGHAGDVPVPEFRGRTMDQVFALADQLGLRVHAVGSGVARLQDHAAQDRVPAGTAVTVTFMPRVPDAAPSSQAAAGPASTAVARGGAP